MPDGDLTDITDTPTTLHATRDGRPAVVVFYRGGWCPYCNLTLRTYERDVVPVVRGRGGALIAISADAPDGSLTWHELTYDVLADPNYTIARQLGIMVTRPTDDTVTQTWREPWVHPQLVPPRTPACRCRRRFSSTRPASSNGSTSTPTTSPERSRQPSFKRWT